MLHALSGFQDQGALGLFSKVSQIYISASIYIILPGTSTPFLRPTARSPWTAGSGHGAPVHSDNFACNKIRQVFVLTISEVDFGFTHKAESHIA